MFGGTKTATLKVAKDIENVFINDMIMNGFVNNEQISLGYLLKNNPNDFAVYERYNGKHMDLFTEISKR